MKSRRRTRRFWNAPAAILEDGRLTDGQGRTVDFRNTVIIMTSNIGTAYAKKGGALGFIRSGSEAAMPTKRANCPIAVDLSQFIPAASV
ncbi:AAA family ATPase [Candidatus Amarolinea dominans]|uniref:AAA family ATPase n=1 Tax=Candidatus Amarolinea dominans TaxID=3140696 RepID=UPI0031CC63EA